ncbi:hypothetical protein CEXT_681641 [Caerostris extrusa]|uniref:Uncharacterized protein n=1 Tax=Caerostris extrusa TaxID=172846 RepID=A0AAV4XYV8_CAEEX|nr:hypothetical protein CEXT_681641 [Caerostris extrusa]
MKQIQLTKQFPSTNSFLLLEPEVPTAKSQSSPNHANELTAGPLMYFSLQKSTAIATSLRLILMLPFRNCGNSPLMRPALAHGGRGLRPITGETAPSILWELATKDGNSPSRKLCSIDFP